MNKIITISLDVPMEQLKTYATAIQKELQRVLDTHESTAVFFTQLRKDYSRLKFEVEETNFNLDNCKAVDADGNIFLPLYIKIKAKEDN